ncbi:hypothetical protein QFC20_006230 [Naganishia adeliensis]|uniref:Uncharacterized protein n=1 Tax=Naganishia adeliensis TaxID=92952 RepID=A0ACC2VEF8_9TREE|nr:hypothetical protein QFC20_006230 [Naganishia adeliensis]
MNRATGRSRGTGLACFKNEDADKALEEAARLYEITGSITTGLNSHPASNPFALPSILTVDSSSQAAAKSVNHVIFPNAPASATLPELGVTKRLDSFNTRRKLLESNPSLYISKTRLSIRQIPLYATDRTLKRLGLYAVRKFDAEVKDGKRDPLTREELQDTTVSPVALAANKKNTGRKTPVMQSKVERQTDRVDGVTGLGRNKGYSFLEMRTHQGGALKVLRWANNNPDVSPLMKEWVTVDLEELPQREKEKLLKAREGERKPDDLDDQELKYNKLQAKFKEGVAGLTDQIKRGKTLLVEFSVESVQVVKRRSEKMTQGAGEPGARRDGAERPRKRKAEGDDDENADEGHA